jgi:hypothetical protein
LNKMMGIKETTKNCLVGRIIKLLSHKSLTRGMSLIPEQSRCLLKGEIHELVTTDQDGLVTESRVDRVGFLGFAEMLSSSIVEVGDDVYFNSRLIGKVIGFDSCHAPNHYNILIKSLKLLTADDLQLSIGEEITFAPGDGTIYRDRNAEMSPVPVIVGYGHAGNRLHLPCIMKALKEMAKTKLQNDTPILVIDPKANLDLYHSNNQHVQFLNSFNDIPTHLIPSAVIHLCAPPHLRVSSFREACKLGIRKFIVEKPLAIDKINLRLVQDILKMYNADITVVSNWTTSQLTQLLLKKIGFANDKGIYPRKIFINQLKSRINRTLYGNTHSNALDVEFPHMIGLAFMLSKGACKVRHASTWDMCIDDKVIPDMGGGEIHLRIDTDLDVYLRSDLCSPVRSRTISIEFSDGSRIEGFFPSDDNDLYSVFSEYDVTGMKICNKYLYDDTLTTFIADSYRFYFNQGVKPISDLAFNLKICTILETAKELCLESKRIEIKELVKVNGSITNKIS